MTLDQIQTKTVGQYVHCPADRGDSAYAWKIEHIGGAIAVPIIIYFWRMKP